MRVAQLDFEPPDRSKFPLLDLAYEALRVGGVSGCLLNAADEVAVAAFLDGRIPYLAIAEIVERTLEFGAGRKASSIAEILEYDRVARARARALVDCFPTPARPVGRLGVPAL
jgi:1-deoxy-D-xylulose-5-phosphate reductoisomerase